MESRDKSMLGSIAGAVAVFALILSMILVGLNNTEKSVEENGLHIAEDAVRRAVISCYALEGSYPESYEYLKDNYAVDVNEDKYIVNYNIFASNIMPDITVIER